ncbi:hypothetical protein BC834DRAFT_831469 [Gloeopeniophorella convolvens]|nr:hypothetical protein BC834DRAFT_831469 [Gloeopeniophorella convolvens]
MAEHVPIPTTRGYQQEMLHESLQQNIVIALDTGAGKTHIAVLRMKLEAERESTKVSWFIAPTVALANQQRHVIAGHLPVSVGLISGANEPDQWRDKALWRRVLDTHHVVISTHDVLLNALRHGYIKLGRDIGLLVFDEAHHAADKHAYNLIMQEFYFSLPPRLAQDAGGIVRPMILGLTASPIFGGDVEKAFRKIEGNLDSIIRAPLLFRAELAGFVHRPQFKHIIYAMSAYQLSGTPPSRSLQSLKQVVMSLVIDEDPYVIHLRSSLKRLNPGPERTRTDQKLSKTIDKKDTFTHRGLRDFERAADEICMDLGPWAADWYIQQVCEQVAGAKGVFPEFRSSWSDSEKTYLVNNLARVEVAPVPDDPEDLLRRSSDKVQKLVDNLIEEKAYFEGFSEEYRSLVFVTRRDAVLALTEVLSRHPQTAQIFNVGSLVGESGNSQRHAFLDITNRLLRKPSTETLQEFRIGELNVIVATAVAEEGLDIQACCSVIRWDPPANMVSWAQSRGRARQKRSTFTVMFPDILAFEPTVQNWEGLERDMARLYNTGKERDAPVRQEDPADDSDPSLRFHVESTGALLSGNSAIQHINHFCSILPHHGKNGHTPVYDIDPPDYPAEWHSYGGSRSDPLGPFGCTLTLPRLLDPRLRTFTTPRIHRSKVSARRHVAFQAYLALYQNGLLNDHLLPLTSVLEPEKEAEVRELLKDIDHRDGTAQVSSQVDPWLVTGSADAWRVVRLEVDGMAPLRMLTQATLPALQDDELPLIHTRELPPFRVRVAMEDVPIAIDDAIVVRAKSFTRRLFWPVYGARMAWDKTDYLHLFIPADESPTIWDERREAFASSPHSQGSLVRGLFAPFEWFEQLYGRARIEVLGGAAFTGKFFQFVRWRDGPITPEEEAGILKRYVHKDAGDDFNVKFDITYPLIEARPFAKRNFLTPMPVEAKGLEAASQKPVLLLKEFTAVGLFSSQEIQWAQWAPSIIRHFQIVHTVKSMRDALFSGTPLADMPLELLIPATTAPVAQERSHYQRLETLGDTVLKYAATIQLLSEHPLWHEGYLARRKDHAVSNVNLAKRAIGLQLYKWIIRDRIVPKRWKPRLLSDPVAPLHEEPKPDMTEKAKRKASVAQNLSTKVLADVVEALIGAAYLHGGFELGVECLKVFDLGLPWRPISERIDDMLSRVIELDLYPAQIPVVEEILGYTFRRKTLAVEALMHASYHSDVETISYERMEFLGDAVLDMIVTDYLFNVPGKEYSPGHLHLRRTAVVNAHFLAMLCLRASTEHTVTMPVGSKHGTQFKESTHRTYLWQCLLHSSVPVLDEQQETFARWERLGGRERIEAELAHGRLFPWSALTSLHAPKFLSDMLESLLGAVFLDSKGDLNIVRGVLRRLGLFEILERIVTDEVDVRHPVSRLYLWASKHHQKVSCSVPKREGSRVSCSALWDNYEIARVEDEWRGRVSQEDVRFAVADQAVALLEDPVSLLQIWLAKRKRSVEYTVGRPDDALECTVLVDGTVISRIRSHGQEVEDDVKRAAAAEALRTLEAPVHWLAFLAAQHQFGVEYQIYEEEGAKICTVYVDGWEVGRFEHRAKTQVVTEEELMAGAAKDAVEVVGQRIADLQDTKDNSSWDDVDWSASQEDWM